MPSMIPQNLWMSRSPLRGGRPPSLGGLGDAVAYFVDSAGNTITSIACGQAFDFRVPGFSQVWLRQTKDGVLQYDGLFNVPMGYYTSSCWSDPGLYHGKVYDPTGTILLSEYDFTVTGSALSGLGGNTGILLIGGAVLLFMFMGKGK